MKDIQISHLQQDVGDPPPAVAGLAVGQLLLGRLWGGAVGCLGIHEVLQLTHVSALQVAAGILLCQRCVLVLAVRLHTQIGSLSGKCRL